MQFVQCFNLCRIDLCNTVHGTLLCTYVYMCICTCIATMCNAVGMCVRVWASVSLNKYVLSVTSSKFFIQVLKGFRLCVRECSLNQRSTQGVGLC